MVGVDSVIQGSVGTGGVNSPPDVRLVQTFLNAVPQHKGGPVLKLAVDGLTGPKTNGSIQRFQYANVGLADGRIDVGKQTELALLTLLGAMGLLTYLLKQVKKETPGPNLPIRGQASPIRRRFMTICKALLPSPGKLSNGKVPKNPVGTGCGEFPGRVFTRVPVLYPYQKGAFKISVPAVGLCYLTSPMTQWEEFAQAVDLKYSPARTWVPFSGNRPLPGDIYVLGQYDNPSEFQHVGIIVDAQGNEWTTADGGQGNGWQSGIMKRRFHPSGQIDGELGNQARLRGWVDLDALAAVAVAAFPENL
ncbi:MAG: hypothetical protein Rubg2KO_33900 [Rubricoccaceae bacterium]